MLNDMTLKFSSAVCGLLLALCSCAAEPGLCDPDALQEALDAARAGDVVRVGNCRVAGAFEVPSGVTVAGHGPAFSVIEVAAEATGLKLLAGQGATVVEGLRLESSGAAAISSRGTAEVRISDVEISAQRGIAIGLEDVDTVVVSDVVMTGPVHEGNAQEDYLITTDNDQLKMVTGTHGLVLFGVTDATVRNASASGFALFGALLVDSSTSWVDGVLSKNLGTGLMVQGGRADITGVEVRETLQGARLLPAYGMIVNETDDVRSTDMIICDGGGVGLLHNAAAGRHDELQVLNNGDAGVWVQDTDEFALAGPSSLISDNKLGGVIVQSSANVTLRDATVQNSLASPWFLEGGRDIVVGDGIQLRDSVENIHLEGLQLIGNERTNLLVDFGAGALTGITFDRVVVQSAQGEGLGAIGQTAADGVLVPESGWDTGIERDAELLARDFARLQALDAVDTAGDGKLPVSQPNLPSIIGPNN